MKNWLKSLSEKQEFILVLCLAFGGFIISSTYEFIEILLKKSSTEYLLDTAQFLKTDILQLSVLLIVFIIFRVRKVGIQSFELKFYKKDILHAIAIFFGAYIVAIIVGLVVNTISPNSTNSNFTFDADIYSFISVLIINSFYEEFFLNAYFFKRLSHWQPNEILATSVILRASYHSYQGFHGIIFVLLYGLLVSGYYTKYKRFWPLVIAHGLFNLSSMLLMQLKN